jgi:signal transduction histidine kinase/CheY-like chemotaxis protein/PAS domain-containing protein
MQIDYLQVIVMLHAGFAAVFFFLNWQRPKRFATLLGSCWAIEAVRAAILLPSVHDWGGFPAYWYSASDVLCLVANVCLLLGCADISAARVPRWLGTTLVWWMTPLLLLCRFALPAVWHATTAISVGQGGFRGVLINLVMMFAVVGISRLLILGWLFRVWRRTRLPGALIAAAFSVPYAVMAFTVPLQFYFEVQGDWLNVLWFVRVLGFSIGLVVLILDLQQSAVARSEASLRAAQALAKLGSWEQDIVTQAAIWSHEMFRLYDRDPALGVMSYEQFLSVIHPDDRVIFNRSETQAISERRSSGHEFRVMRPDGTIRWIRGQTTPVYNAAGGLVRLIGTEQEITDRKRAETFVELQHVVTQELTKARTLDPTAGRILEMVGRGLGWEFAALWTLDRTTKVLKCADVWHAAAPGPADFITATRNLILTSGKGFPGRILEARRPLAFSTTSQEIQFIRQAVAKRANFSAGIGFPIMVCDEAIGVVELFGAHAVEPDAELQAVMAGLGAQIGQFLHRLRLEEEHRQSQKLEAVGTLAGGIAHDFNNILTAISGYTELAKLEAAGPVLEHLNSVQIGARRAAELVKQILAFSRRQDQLRAPLQLEEVLREALGLLRATLPSTIEIRSSFGGEIPPVLADATSIHQVIVNLGTNAWHAMKDCSGVLSVTLEKFECRPVDAGAHPGMLPGTYAKLSVSDTGHGMEPAILARVFEPFFTTKQPGEGTGLGLSVVHGIVQSHDAAIFVSSQPGQGTQFNLFFPACTEEGKSTHSDESENWLPAGQGQRILFVDDEVMLTKMGKRILERLGYVVETHISPVSAWQALQARPDGYDLLVTDLTMPVMNGMELAHQVLGVRPTFPIVLMSGYAATLTKDRLGEAGIREFLPKPHTMNSLALAVHRALGGEANQFRGREAGGAGPGRETAVEIR